MADKKVQWTRTKTHEHAHLEAGKGLPESVSRTLKKHIQHDYERLPLHIPRPRAMSDWDTLVRRSVTPKSIITQVSALLDLDEYEFPEEDDIIDPHNIDAKLDVTALDRYNDDIRRLRKWTIDECRLLPHKGHADELMLSKIKAVVRCLCRSTYYGTHKAQVLAEGAVILIVWLLNRRNISAAFKVHILQSFAEMLWTSAELKSCLYKCHGIRVIAKLMVNGLHRAADQARWACYTLAMASVGSPDIIEGIAHIPRIDEAVGEIAFDTYWTDWPANFGSILQGILYGPHSVCPAEDTFDFI